MSKKLRVIVVVLAAAFSISSSVFSAPPCKALGCGPQRYTSYLGAASFESCEQAKSELNDWLYGIVGNDCVDEGAAAVCFEQHIIEESCTEGPFPNEFIAHGYANYKCEQ